jgi:hypothetical protein
MRIAAVNPRDIIFNGTRQFVAYAHDVAKISTVGVQNKVLTQIRPAAISTRLVITLTQLSI